MKIMLKKSCFAFFLTFLVVAAGCQRGPARPPGLPDLTPCVLTLTQEGAPLAGAGVSLHTDGASREWVSGGISDENGVVTIRTNGRYPGAPSGKYKIIVQKTERDPSKLPPEPPIESTEYPAWQARADQEVRATYSLVEKPFTDPKATPLEIDLSGSKEVKATYEVGKKIREKI